MNRRGICRRRALPRRSRTAHAISCCAIGPSCARRWQRQRRDWVFLFEAPATATRCWPAPRSRSIRALLDNAEPDDTFAILTANTQVHRFTGTAAALTPENIAAAVAFLEQCICSGALDLDAGLDGRRSVYCTLAAIRSWCTRLGTNRPRRTRAEASWSRRIPHQRPRYVGVGVGKRWTHDFMKCAARTHVKGMFTQINPDEPVAWRVLRSGWPR